MLNLDRVKTLTIYTQKQLKQLTLQFKMKLNSSYQQQSPDNINSLIIYLQLFHLLMGVQGFSKESNQSGERAMNATLQILFAKTAYWKSPFKQQCRKWISVLLEDYSKTIPDYKVKPQMLGITQYLQPLQYFSRALTNQLPNLQSLSVLVSFLRVYIINQIQNNKKTIQFRKNDKLLTEWKNILQNLINASRVIDNRHKQQICISICYWMCSVQKMFISQCIHGGMISFLLKSLNKSDTTESYGKKIINFLKLLLLANPNNILIDDLETALARFSQLYDNPQISDLIGDLFRTFKLINGSNSDQIEVMKDLYNRYQTTPNEQNTSKLLDFLRILMLRNQKINKDLSKPQNKEFLKDLLQKQNNLQIIKSILLLLANNCYDQNMNLELIEIIINSIDSLLKSHQKQLKGNNCKYLINICKTLTKLLGNNNTYQKVANLIKDKNIQDKLQKYSDRKVLAYERHLFQLRKLLNIDVNYKNDSKRFNQMIVTVILASENKKKHIQEDLQQVQSIYNLIKKDPHQIDKKIIQTIPNKFYQYGDQNNKVSVSILDHSQNQHIRHVKDLINFFTIKSLSILGSNNQLLLKNKNSFQKTLKAGINSHNKDVVEASGDYVTLYLQKNQLPSNQEETLHSLQKKLNQFGFYKTSQFIAKKLIKEKPQQQVMKTIEVYLEKANKEQIITQEQQNHVISRVNTLSNQESLKIIDLIKNCIQKNGSLLSLNYFFKIIYKLSQIQLCRRPIFQYLSSILKDNYYQCIKYQDSELKNQNTRLLYLIFHQLLISANNKQVHNYFQPIFNKSLFQVSVQSLKFTEECLTMLSYKYNQTRIDLYMKFIYNNPQLIGREGALIITQEKSDQHQFWLKFRNYFNKLVQKQNTQTLHFLQFYITRNKINVWQKYSIGELIQILLNNCLIHLNEFQGQSQLLYQIIRKFKICSKIIYQSNINQTFDLTNIYYRQNQVLIKCIEGLCLIIEAKPPLQHHLKPIIFDLINTLLHIYRQPQGSVFLLRNVQKLFGLFKVLISLKDAQINDKLIQIIRIGLLKDSQLTNYTTLKRLAQSNRHQLQSVLTSCGADHMQSIKQIFIMIEKRNLQGIKKEAMRYLFGQNWRGDENNVSQIDGQIDQAQLLKYIKNLLHPPYKYGLNSLVVKLRKINNNQFANTLVKVFIISQHLYHQDTLKPTLSLQSTQQMIINSISPEHTDLSSQFYQMIGMNKIGMSFCLQKKGIGIKGVTIVAKKMLMVQQYIPLCANILVINVRNEKQLNVLFELGIATIVNQKYFLKGKIPQYGRSLGNLIGSSSKSKKIQQAYTITNESINNLNHYRQDHISLASTMYALSGLVYLNQANRSKVGTYEKIKFILELTLQNINNTIVVQKGCNLLSNLIYKNKDLKKIYLSLEIHQKAIKVIPHYLTYEIYPHSTIKQLLRLIGNLSMDFQVSYQLSQLKFMSISNSLILKACQAQDQSIIKYSIDIFYNMVNYPEQQVRPIALAILQEGYVQTLFFILKSYVFNPQIVQSCLDSYQCVCCIDKIKQESYNKQVYNILCQVQKIQQWNEQIIDKWFKVIYKLSKQNNQQIIRMLDTGILYNAINFLRAHNLLRPQTIRILIGIINGVIKANIVQKYHKSGFIDFVIQVLAIKNLSATDVNYILELLFNLNTSKVLNSQNLTKFFQSMIKRLQVDYKDQNATKIIKFIKKVKQKIIITIKSANILYQFSYLFLTQSQIINSQSYHRRVREFISLLSYFISFNVDLKIIFKEEVFIGVIKNWIKIDTLIHQDNTIVEACRLCLFSILNDQKFLAHLSEMIDIQTNMKYAINGYKCLLYRKNKTNKFAIIKLNKQTMQIVSFKAPNGQIKQKYRIPTLQLVNFRHTFSKDDVLYKQSVFYDAGSFFNKQPKLQNCVSLFGLVGDDLSIRQINVEFQNNDIKEMFSNNFKIILSSLFKNKNNN